MKNNIFYQDFLFEDLPVDEKDNPVVTVRYADSYQGSDCKISFDQLLKMEKQEDWEGLCSKITGKTVEIIDDVHLENEEMERYKKFYLATYFYILSKYSSSCVVDLENEMNCRQMTLCDYMVQ